jgi:actin-related protein 5
MTPSGAHAPLIIDKYVTNLRFGFSTSGSKAALTPHSVPNVIARFKVRKYNESLWFGDGVDAESGSKGQAKMPWVGDVLTTAQF